MRYDILGWGYSDRPNVVIIAGNNILFYFNYTYDQDGDNLFDSEVDDVQSTWFLQNYTEFDTEGKLAMYFLGACNTGTFVGRECLTEYITRNVGIGCFGASGSAEPDPFGYDGDHLGWLTQGLKERFWEQLLVLGNNQPGKALALAKYDYGLDRVEMDGEDDGGRTLAQYNLMGDPEVPIWVDIPHQLNVSIDQPFNNNSNTMTLKITANRDPVEGATITYTKGNNLLWKGDTNENGTIDVPFSDIEVGDNVFTASKKGYLPFQANLPEENGNSSSIVGYDLIIIFIVILTFLGLTSIYYKHSR